MTVEEAVESPTQALAPTASDDGSARAVGENEGDKQVRKSKGKVFDMAWDKLVVAVGCYSQTYDTPGVREHAYFLKDVGDARKIRKRLLSCKQTWLEGKWLLLTYFSL